jgi:predicted transcriptional regulator
MATMVMEPAIKTAMNKMGLEERAEELLDILDKIELDRNLAVSMEQAAKGMKRPAREVLEEIKIEVLGEKRS